MKDYLDGIYFGVPEDEYLSIDRLSTSGICDLRISPADYWSKSPLNPNRKLDDETTRAMILGRAYHKARLEPGEFPLRFVRELSKDDYPSDMLTTSTAIADALGELGEAKTKAGESVLEKAKRLRAAGYGGLIWHEELDLWEQDLQGRQPIKGEYFDQIVIDMVNLRRTDLIDDLLSNGEAEVSILWTDANGIRMKCRVDWLRADGWVEVKTFSNSAGKHVNNAIRDAFMYRRYHIGAAVYRDAIETVRSGKLAIVSENYTPEQQALIDAIRGRSGELTCDYVFQQTGGVPNVLSRRFAFWELRESPDLPPISKTALFQKAEGEIAAAKRDWVNYREIYAPGEPWMPWSPVGEFTDMDFPAYWLQEEA
jgi:hypothetical protein